MTPSISRVMILAASLISGSVQTASTASELKSVSRIAFGPPDTLFVADWMQSKVYAMTLPAAEPSAGVPFNILDLDIAMHRALGTSDVKYEDLAARPGSNEVYVSVTAGTRKEPEILRIKADGSVQKLDTAALKTTSAELDKAPDTSLKLWTNVPGRSFTVTDMKWREGKLYLAGLSNQSFSSALRIVPYPFGKGAEMASIEMYHTSHDQMETRAPIRAMAFADLDGKPHLIAAYLCTPLVTIPLDALKDGAHVKAKTIAELGDAGTPSNVLPFTARDMMTGKPVNYILAANLFRDGSLIPVTSIEEANRGAGYSKPVAFGQVEGVQRISTTMSTVMRIDNQDDTFFVALRRDLPTGHAQLVSINKLATFRLSDYDISEFMLPGYTYTTDPMHDGTRRMQNMLKTEEGYPNAVRN